MIGRLLPLLPAFLAPAPAGACAVCFGQSGNGDVGRAYTWGIFVLASFTEGHPKVLLEAMVDLAGSRPLQDPFRP